MCDQAATSDEHVPPRCLFPKSKDLPSGVSLRRELITVPSCTNHNTEKSLEDQYFMNVIAGLEGINEVGRGHYRKQFRRQHARKPGLLHRFRERAVDIEGRLGHKVEIQRLDAFVKQLAHALYFAHFRNQWRGDLGWIPEFLSRVLDTDPDAEGARLATIEENDLRFKGVPFHGANPQVFAYQVLETEEQCAMRLHFYEGCRIFLTFSVS